MEKYGKLVYKNIGASMMPLIRQKRDLMVIEKKPPCRCRKYDAVLYKRRDGKYILHRILKVRENDYVICGDNCIHREYGITDEQILGVMTAVVRDKKTIFVSDKKYLIYVHLWCDFFYVRVAVLYVKKFIGSLLGKMKKLFMSCKEG